VIHTGCIEILGQGVYRKLENYNYAKKQGKTPSTYEKGVR
jgi:hypothetical protein